MRDIAPAVQGLRLRGQVERAPTAYEISVHKGRHNRESTPKVPDILFSCISLCGLDLKYLCTSVTIAPPAFKRRGGHN